MVHANLMEEDELRAKAGHLINFGGNTVLQQLCEKVLRSLSAKHDPFSGLHNPQIVQV